MSRLFLRQWRLRVGPLDLSDLDLSFKIERSTRRLPNAAEIKIWNLSRDTRATIEAGNRIVLHAGFEDPPVIFSGDLRFVWTERESVDSVTVLSARDGGRAYADAEISRSYAAGVGIESVLRDCVSDMGIGVGNLADFTYSMRSGPQTFADGFTAHGRASRVLNDILRGCGFRWSVQHGALQIQQHGRALQTREVLLSPNTGLIGSPSWDESGKQTGGRRGVLTARSLIRNGLEPGRLVRVDSESATGDFEIQKGVYTGNTRSDDWYCDLELRTPR